MATSITSFFLNGMPLLQKEPQFLCRDKPSDSSMEPPNNFYRVCSKEMACDSENYYSMIDYDNSINNLNTGFHFYCMPTIAMGGIGSSFMLGVILGSLFIPVLADKYGRKPVLYLSMAITLFCTLGIIGAAPNKSLLFVFMFILGIVSIGYILVGYFMLCELTTEDRRPFLSACNSIIYGLNGVVSVLFLLIFPNWIAFLLFTAMINLCFLLSWKHLPESPRFLVGQGKVEEAKEIFAYIAKMNKTEMFRTELESPNDKESNTTEASTLANIKILMKNPEHMKKLLVMIVVWMANTLIYYGLLFNISSLSGNVYWNTAIFCSMDALSCYLTYPLIRFAGRRNAMIFDMYLIAFCMTIFAINQSPFITILFLLILGKFGITSSFNIGFLYTSELFPTNVRGTAYGICNSVGRISGVFAPLLGGSIWAMFGLGVFALITGSLLFKLEETGGKPMEDFVKASFVQEVDKENKTEYHAMGEISK